MSTIIKAIETRYKNYRFRSRLEARWAVFFDALGIAWEYEKEGYDLGDAGWYLPDFWLPEQEVWVEVKGDSLLSNEKHKAFLLADETGYSVLVVQGQPGIAAEYGRVQPNVDTFLGYHYNETFDPYVDWKGGAFDFWAGEFPAFLHSKFPDAVLPHPYHLRWGSSAREMRAYCLALIELDRTYYRDAHGEEHPKWKYGISSTNELRRKSGPGFFLMYANGSLRVRYPSSFEERDISSAVFNAYAAARSARFEHGESGVN